MLTKLDNFWLPLYCRYFLQDNLYIRDWNKYIHTYNFLCLFFWDNKTILVIRLFYCICITCYFIFYSLNTKVKLRTIVTLSHASQIQASTKNSNFVCLVIQFFKNKHDAVFPLLFLFLFFYKNIIPEYFFKR